MCYTGYTPIVRARGMAIPARTLGLHHMVGGHTAESGMADTPTKKPSKKKRQATVGEKTQAGLVVAPTSRPSKALVDQSNWRRKLQAARIKFDDKAKQIFLSAFADTGLKKRSADAAGVCLLTIIRHQKNDPDFAEAYDEALASYRDKFVGKAINELAYEGIKHERKDKTTGEVIEEWREYPIPLVLAELKRIDPGFRDKQDISIGVGGGVLVVSGPLSPEEWVADQEEKNKLRTNPMIDDPFSAARLMHAPPQDVIDVEVVEVKLPDRAEEVAARAAKQIKEVAALKVKVAGLRVIR